MRTPWRKHAFVPYPKETGFKTCIICGQGPFHENHPWVNPGFKAETIKENQ